MSTKISQPAAPAAPSTTSSVQDWVNNLPTIYETQMKYAPLEAQQQVQLAQQYATPLAQAYYDAQKAMYPEAVGMQEQLANQAKAGMDAGLSDWEKNMYQSDLASQLGGNVGSGIGADYMSRGMLQAQQQRQDYYRNLGLSVAGLQPVQQASGAQTSNYMGGFTPNSVMSSNNQNYGTMANIYGTQSGMATANAANKSAMINAGIGAVGSMGSAFMMPKG